MRGRRAQVETVEQTLQAEEIRYIPGTQGDTLKAVQNLPGVARAPYGIGLLPVWGSSPADSRVYLDGTNIPALYHFGGLRSTVNSEMVDALSFVPGGYQADHGLALGGIIDVLTRRPRTDGLHGYAQFDLLDGSAMLEGPLTSKLSFAAAARRSWVDKTLPYFTSSSLQLSPVYWDYQARLSYRATTRDTVDVFLLGSDDRLNVLATSSGMSATQAAAHNYFHRGILGWTRRLEGGGTFAINSSIGYDVPLNLGINFGGTASSIDARTLGLTTRAILDVPVRPWLRLFGGIDYEGSRFTQQRSGVARPPVGGASGASVGGFGEQTGSFDGMSSGFATDDLTVYGNQVAPFLVATFSLLDKRLTVTPQMRLQLSTFAGYPGEPESFTNTHVTADPRFSIRYQVITRVALKGAFGLYTQPPTADALSAVFGNPNLEPQRATHTVFGVDVDITSTLRLETAGFWKDMRNLVVPGAGPEDPVMVNDGRGRAYGAEFLLRQQMTRKFFGWIAYTLSRSERMDHPGEPWHRYLYDQTNILTLLASYDLPRGFKVGGRFRYVTGDPVHAGDRRVLRLERGSVRADQRAVVQRAAARVQAARRAGRQDLDVRPLAILDLPGRAERHAVHQPGGVQLQLRLHRVQPAGRLAAAADHRVERRLLMTARSTAMAVAVALACGGCKPDNELPRTYINGPQVLAIKADPPSVPPGGSTTISTLIAGTGGETPSVSWVRCRRAPRPGEAINPDCVDTAQADYLEPIGDGTTITTTMPDDVTASALGQPDATGSVYLTLVARVTVAGQTLIATYRLRLQSDGDVNQNPVLTGLLLVDAAGVATPLEAAAPPTVHAGDRLTLQVAVADGSVETYPPPLGGSPRARDAADVVVLDRGEVQQ